MTTTSLCRAAIVSAMALVSATRLGGAETCKRILEQDPTRNNLVDPPGYRTAPLGTLGEVVRAGTGSRAMILVPGLGFGAGVLGDFMAGYAADYRLYAVTLAGFGGTAAPPSPPEATSFGEQTWTNGALAGIETLMADERIEDAVVVGHWIGGTQIALRLAMRHPEKIRAVILLAGSARMTTSDPQRAPHLATLERRVAAIDQYMAPKWFKTVTRETWDDNNFLPGDYAIDPVRGLRLWREAARPALHVWVRYLCEFNAQDVCLEMDRLTVPTLLLEPGLENLPHDPGNNYMEGFCRGSWSGCIENRENVTVHRIAHARACPWFDQPTEVRDRVREFLGGLTAPRPPHRPS
jgi:pimeloyl-ACP methyl ester carboxylesterase